MDLSEIDKKYTWIRPAIVVALITLSVVLEVVVHIYLSTAVAYTHIFYLVIALTGIWYYRKAAYIALGFGLIHIAVDYWLTGTLDPAAVVRAVMFVIVAYVIGALSESSNFHHEERERKHKALIGFITEVALRIKTPISVIQENLSGICHGIETGEMDNEEITAALQVQISHTEKILATLRELNQAVIDEQKDIPDSYADLLTR
ncbi:hypothetical protein [Methanofollis fontis]|uniref:Uncharacterized protein n=1 Tax=Methanofollis fontis TaxID=2052832 RepID=A0A483CRN1_9EURY|nr:hypothetical protein [Methanofollis fontis]TAJ45478.1 hypothetical protein CUJ86_01750 [Methanofollis fontis]